MAARAALMVGRCDRGRSAVHLVISTILGLPGWAVITSAVAVAAVIKSAGRSAETVGRERRPARGIVDRAGKSLGIGDTVRAGSVATGRWNWASAGAWWFRFSDR